jgi:hypothetical protein
MAAPSLELGAIVCFQSTMVAYAVVALASQKPCQAKKSQQAPREVVIVLLYGGGGCNRVRRSKALRQRRRGYGQSESSRDQNKFTQMSLLLSVRPLPISSLCVPMAQMRL